MSFCTNCGKPIDEQAKFCPECGAKQKIFAEETATDTAEVAAASQNTAPAVSQATNKFCTHCGGAIDENAVICVHCGCPVEDKKPAAVEPKKKDCGFAIAGFVLSFFVAILGLIFSCLALGKIKKEPELSGKGLAIAGIIISGVNLVLMIYRSFFSLVFM